MLRAVLALAVIAAVLAGTGWLGINSYDAPGPLLEPRTIVVPHASLEQVADHLTSEGVVGHAVALRIAATLTRMQGPIHAGELAFPAHASLRDVLTTLRTSRPIQHRLLIPEGLTAAQVALLFDKAAALDGPAPVPEEGSILPDTYSYELGIARTTLMERGARAMERALDRAWAARTGDAAPLATPHDALVLASIVERETGRTDERARVAAVFLNRLRRGMKLQSDPTVVYGASGGLGTLDHGITRAELERDDPYNTYRVTGLPPGPISMPGLAALKAVTQPMVTDELFFVADGAGGHVFARTEQEHARNVARWRETERQRRAAAVAN